MIYYAVLLSALDDKPTVGLVIDTDDPRNTYYTRSNGTRDEDMDYRVPMLLERLEDSGRPMPESGDEWAGFMSEHMTYEYPSAVTEAKNVEEATTGIVNLFASKSED